MRTVLLICTLLCTATTMAQHTTRRHALRPETPVAERISMPFADTVAYTESTSVPVRLSGFDKALSSHRESFFVENKLDSADIVWLSLTIDYLDTSGRQLHRRRARFRCDIPAGETRRIDIPTWDKQGVYYYRKSEPRRRVQASAAPFEVSISVDSAAYCSRE